jgi:hypothetical protein
MTTDTRRDLPRPFLNHQSAAILDEAVHTLIMLRAPMHEGDASASLHAVISIIRQANSVLPELVAEARDQDHTWSEIAAQLRVSRIRAIVQHLTRTPRPRPDRPD